MKKHVQMNTAEFARVAGVTPSTVRGYCRAIYGGRDETLKKLRDSYGLIGVAQFVSSRQWILYVDKSTVVQS